MSVEEDVSVLPLSLAYIFTCPIPPYLLHVRRGGFYILPLSFAYIFTFLIPPYLSHIRMDGRRTHAPSRRVILRCNTPKNLSLVFVLCHSERSEESFYKTPSRFFGFLSITGYIIVAMDLVGMAL